MGDLRVCESTRGVSFWHYFSSEKGERKGVECSIVSSLTT